VTNYLAQTKRVTLQLSNLCPYAPIHRKCPVSQFADKKVLPRAIVDNVLGTLAAWDFPGWLAFHVYNEPTVDPRLMLFIERARQLLTGKIDLWSNGWYMTEGLLRELHAAGVSRFVFSAYSKADYERFAGWHKKYRRRRRTPRIRIRVYNRAQHGLDSRLQHNRERPTTRRCYAPLHDLTVYASGKIGLCCHDWDERVTFGDLNQVTFAEAMNTGYRQMKRLAGELGRGRRKLEWCRKCPTRRHRV
jgi:hypothetical protein